MTPSIYGKLTTREKDVLSLKLRGKSDRQIAEALEMTTGRVSTTLQNARDKMLTHSSIAAAKRARQLGQI